jgi:hypothetical protein
MKKWKITDSEFYFIILDNYITLLKGEHGLF